MVRTLSFSIVSSLTSYSSYIVDFETSSKWDEFDEQRSIFRDFDFERWNLDKACAQQYKDRKS